MPALTDNQEQFVTYVRTKMFFRQRLRNTDHMEPVHIPKAEIEKRFFTWPQYDYKQVIQHLIDAGEIERTIEVCDNGNTKYFYKALKAGQVNLALLDRKQDRPLDDITRQMKRMLMYASLPDATTSTLYFDSFLQFREKHLDLFFKVDVFSGRVHTPVSSFHREYRPHIRLLDEETTSLDVATMQPLLLGKILKSEIGANEYSEWIESGHDIYVMLQQKAGLPDRDSAKKRFFEIMFAPASKQLSDMFGAANWIEWINDFKQRPHDPNPRTLEKQHSNMAWLLQTTEVEVMRKVWKSLIDAGIIFLSVHDEVIVRKVDLPEAHRLFSEVLQSEFTYFKLNGKSESDKSDESDASKKSFSSTNQQIDLSEYDEATQKAVQLFLDAGFEIIPQSGRFNEINQLPCSKDYYY
jgi:hypothetical protein